MRAAVNTAGGAFDRIARVLLPSGGYIMTLVEAYFDESATHAGSPVMSLAGYLFEQGKSERMAAEWRAFLAEKGLPFLHMADCAPGNGPYKHLNSKQRSLVVTRMIGLIKQYTVQGIGVVLDLEDFRRRFGEKCFFGTPYTFCFHQIALGVAHWAEKTKYEGEIAYFFEAGHSSGSEANDLLNFGLEHTEMRNTLHYAGHAFVEKAKAPQVQAADLLAWSLTKNFKCSREGRPIRKDYNSLAQHHHNIALIGADVLAKLEPYWEGQRQQALEMLGDLAKPTIHETGREARRLEFQLQAELKRRKALGIE